MGYEVKFSEIPPLWLIATDTFDGKPGLPLSPSPTSSNTACAVVIAPADVPEMPMLFMSILSSFCFFTRKRMAASASCVGSKSPRKNSVRLLRSATPFHRLYSIEATKKPRRAHPLASFTVLEAFFKSPLCENPPPCTTIITGLMVDARLVAP